MKRAWTVSLVLVSAVVSCGPEDAERTRREKGQDRAGGAIVATLDGRGIRADEVARIAKLMDLPPAEALNRLIRQELLFGEAERRGYGTRREVRIATDRALVQAALSRFVEAEVPPESIEEDAIDEAYRKDASRFEVPEKRASAHLLVTLPKEPSDELVRRAERYVQSILDALASAESPVEELEKRAEAKFEGREVLFETLAEYPRSGRLARPFEDALFDAPGVGWVPAPVRTSYGVHAIFVTRIVPGTVTPRDEARSVLAKELLERARFERLRSLVASLEREFPVVRHEVRAESP